MFFFFFQMQTKGRLKCECFQQLFSDTKIAETKYCVQRHTRTQLGKKSVKLIKTNRRQLNGHAVSAAQKSDEQRIEWKKIEEINESKNHIWNVMINQAHKNNYFPYCARGIQHSLISCTWDRMLRPLSFWYIHAQCVCVCVLCYVVLFCMAKGGSRKKCVIARQEDTHTNCRHIGLLLKH